MQLVTWGRTVMTGICAASLALVASPATSAERLPSTVAGAWRITRLLPTGKAGCWSAQQARALVGTTLSYSPDSMRWRDGEVSLEGVATRQVTAAQFEKENSSSAGGADFAQLGIRGSRVLEVDLQHEDMDITGASTEVPGDSILVVAPNRIVISACGVFLEATRAASAGNLLRTSAKH